MFFDVKPESNKIRKARQRAEYHAHFRKNKHTSRSTTGISKGIKATTAQKGACRRNRSWKWSNYTELMQSLGRRAGSKT